MARRSARRLSLSRSRAAGRSGQPQAAAAAAAGQLRMYAAAAALQGSVPLSLSRLRRVRRRSGGRGSVLVSGTRIAHSSGNRLTRIAHSSGNRLARIGRRAGDTLRGFMLRGRRARARVRCMMRFR